MVSVRSWGLGDGEKEKAPDPSTSRPEVGRAAWGAGKYDPSRGPDTPDGDRDDPGGLPDWPDGGGGRRRPTPAAPASGTGPSNTRGRDRMTRRSRTVGCSADMS